MNQNDYRFIALLAVYAAFIWLRDLAWASTADDTLPILAAIPLFVWFGMPWKFTQETRPVSVINYVVVVVTLVLGIGLNFTFLLAISWTWLLWTWLSSRLEKESLEQVKKLIVLPLMAFPWVSLDGDRLGWWFRLSGAWATEHFFSLIGLDAVREGTILVINKVPVSVEAACAGMNTLQAMLISGTLANYLILGQTSRYWWNLPMLLAMAWVSNTVRIIVICIIAIIWGPEVAMGSFHTWGGWLVLLLMFALCWLILSLQEPKAPNKAEKT